MGGDEFDPSSDPELAMALRMSLQEAQEREARQTGETSAPTTTEVGVVPQDIVAPSNPEAGHTAGLPDAVTAPLSNANDSTVPEAPGDEDGDDEEAMLARAMALSRGEGGDDDVLMGEDDDEEDEEAAIARAIAMSLEEQKGDK